METQTITSTWRKDLPVDSVWAFIGSCDCRQWILGPSPHTSLPPVIINLSYLWDILNWVSVGSSESLGPHLPPAAQTSPPHPGMERTICSHHYCSRPRPLSLFSSRGIVSAPPLKCVLSGHISCHCPPHLLCSGHINLYAVPFVDSTFSDLQAFANAPLSIWVSLPWHFIWETIFCLWSSSRLAFSRKRSLIT